MCRHRDRCVYVKTDVSVYRTWNLKMKATFSPKHNFSCVMLHDWDVTSAERCLVSAVYGRQVEGQAGAVFSFSSLRTAGRGTGWAAKIRPICCTETALTTSLHCVTSQKCKHLVSSDTEPWNHSRLRDCQHWEKISVVSWVQGIKYLSQNIF